MANVKMETALVGHWKDVSEKEFKGLRFKDEVDIKMPLSEKNPGNLFSCKYCDFSAPTKRPLKKHIKIEHGDRRFTCSFCEKIFAGRQALSNHENSHTGTKLFLCELCFSNFTTHGELVRHTKFKHSTERPNKCPYPYCDYAAVELSRVKKHIGIHTGEKPFQCQQCSYAAPLKTHLKRHESNVHRGEQPYECDICHARFTQQGSMVFHRKGHTGDKPKWQCEFCMTTTSRKIDLQAHVKRQHTSTGPLSCNKCSNIFKDWYSLKMHKRTHSGERCFKCSFCSFSSLTSQHLEFHMLKHTGLKPFECSQCSQRFKLKVSLKRHLNLNHNPDYVGPDPDKKKMVCEQCGKSFKQRAALINHLAKHHSKNIKSEGNPTGREYKDEVIEETKKRVAEIGIEHVEVPSAGMTCPLEVKEELDDTENMLEVDEELEEGEVRLDEAEKQAVDDKLIPHKVMPDITQVMVMGEIRIKKEEDKIVLNQRGADRANLFGFDEYLDDENDFLFKVESV